MSKSQASILPALLLAVWLPAAALAEGEAISVVHMDAAERQRQGIVTAAVQRRPLAEVRVAPGEVRLNAYRTARITPRIAAQIVQRHKRLGESVREDDPLVTLSSVVMAEAQGALIEAEREWQRVRRLGRQVVSEKRYVAAQVARQQAHARVSAYGMTDRQIRRLLESGDAARANGRFDLLSPLDGTIIRDDFVLGEVIEPGRVLFEISDERRLWVEARLEPGAARQVVAGGTAWIDAAGERLAGRVLLRHKRIDAATRTLAVRVAVENAGDRLHPGQFVEVELPVSAARPQLAVPAAAVVLMQGVPTVFRVEGDTLRPHPVETGPARGGWVPVKAGLAAGDIVVVQGAFLLKSLLLKSQMGEDHH